MLRCPIDAAAGGAFLSLTTNGAIALIEKMVSNQGWSDDRLQTCQKGMHTMKETDTLAAKLDLLMKCLNERAIEREAMHGTVKAMDSHITCEICDDVGHSGNDCPETREDAAYINNGFRPQGGQGWNNQSRP
jgi:hypothetical protein